MGSGVGGRSGVASGRGGGGTSLTLKSNSFSLSFVIYFLSAPGQSGETGSKSLRVLFELEVMTYYG